MPFFSLVELRTKRILLITFPCKINQRCSRLWMKRKWQELFRAHFSFPFSFSSLRKWVFSSFMNHSENKHQTNDDAFSVVARRGSLAWQLRRSTIEIPWHHSQLIFFTVHRLRLAARCAKLFSQLFAYSRSFRCRTWNRCRCLIYDISLASSVASGANNILDNAEFRLTFNANWLCLLHRNLITPSSLKANSRILCFATKVVEIVSRFWRRDRAFGGSP